MPNRDVLCTVLLISIPASLSGQSNTATSKALPLTVVDTSKTFPSFVWAQLADHTAAVFLQNPGADTLSVHAGVRNLQRLPSPVGSFQEFELVVTPQSAEIKSLETQRFELQPSSVNTPLPGTYVGFLVVEDTHAKLRPLSQQFRVVVDGPRLALPKLTKTFFRLFPLGRCSYWLDRTITIPLTEPISTASLEQRSVGALRTDTGRWVNAHWQTAGTNSQNSFANSAMTNEPVILLDSPPAAGKYEGDLTVSLDPDKATVGVTVIAKDIVLLPLATIFLGTLLAFRIKRYLGVLRTTWGLREQEAQLGPAFRTSEKDFLAASFGQPFGKYSISADLISQRKEVLDRLKKIERGWTTTLDTNNPDYAFAVKTLQNLQAGITAWPRLAEGLSGLAKGLRAAQDAVEDVSTASPPAESPAPRLLSYVGSLVCGKVIAIAEASILATNVYSGTTLLVQWMDAFGQFRELNDAVGQLASRPDLLQPQQDEVRALRDESAAIWVKLWEATSPTDLSDIAGYNGAINVARIHLAQLKDQLPAERAPLATATSRSQLQAFSEVNQSWFLKISNVGFEPDDQRRAAQLKTIIYRSDLAATVFAGFVGLLTGLNTFYLGKPFGSLQDYITLFLWAAGTKVVLDLLVGVVDKLAPQISAR